jgi:hypothetical protein
MEKELIVIVRGMSEAAFLQSMAVRYDVVIHTAFWDSHTCTWALAIEGMAENIIRFKRIIDGQA